MPAALHFQRKYVFPANYHILETKQKVYSESREKWCHNDMKFLLSNWKHLQLNVMSGLWHFNHQCLVFYAFPWNCAKASCFINLLPPFKNRFLCIHFIVSQPCSCSYRAQTWTLGSNVTHGKLPICDIIPVYLSKICACWLITCGKNRYTYCQWSKNA